MNDAKHWFALFTKPRQEFKAEGQLKIIGINSYLPVVNKVKQWSDRKKKISEPVLRSYIFIQANEAERLTALEQTSIIRCLSEHRRPAVIPEWQIENLKRMLDYKAEYFVYEGLVSGTKVEIKEGPFAGVIGIVRSGTEGKTLAVTVELLNRTIIAYLPKESVERIID